MLTEREPFCLGIPPLSVFQLAIVARLCYILDLLNDIEWSSANCKYLDIEDFTICVYLAIWTMENPHSYLEGSHYYRIKTTCWWRNSHLCRSTLAAMATWSRSKSDWQSASLFHQSIQKIHPPNHQIPVVPNDLFQSSFSTSTTYPLVICYIAIENGHL